MIIEAIYLWYKSKHMKIHCYRYSPSYADVILYTRLHEDERGERSIDTVALDERTNEVKIANWDREGWWDFSNEQEVPEIYFNYMVAQAINII